MNYDLTPFQKDLKELNITLNSNQISQFISYYELLTDWNSKINLTAITDFDSIFKKHFIDSLSLVKAIDYLKDRNIINNSNIINNNIIDIGTGAGFPGIPLKIAYPKINITLLDSLNKRIKFLNEVVSNLKLPNVNTLHGRAEDFAKPEKLRETFDLCVSRAVANMSTLSEYCIPFVKLGGYFIAYKSEKLNEEMIKAEKAIALLGGKTIGQVDFLLPNSDISRNFVIIQKIEKTNKKYPRKAGLPAKEPLIE